MPHILVTQTKFTVAAGAGSQANLFPGTLKTNDVAILVLGSDGNIFADGGLSTSGYTDVEKYNGDNPGVHIAWKRMGATPDTGVTVVGHSGSVIAGIVQVWRGTDTSTALDQTSAGVADVATNSKPNNASITTVTNGALVVITAVLDDDDTEASVVAPAGYTNMIAKDTGQGSVVAGCTVMMASREIPIAGAEDPAIWAMTGEDTWRSQTIALRPSALGVVGRSNDIAAIRNNQMHMKLRRGMTTGRRK